jgi:hypothetical protein
MYLLLHVWCPLWWEDGSVFCSAHHSHWSESRRTHNHILLSHLSLTLPGGPSPHIHIIRNRVFQLHLRTPGSPTVASHNLQDYGGGILIHLHTTEFRTEVTGLYNSGADTIESSIWINNEMPSFTVWCQGNSFCIDSRTYFTSVAARTCPATSYSLNGTS